MKKMPDKLKIDRRKKRINQLRDNGFSEVMRENKSENSGLVKIKRRRIEMLQNKITETTNQSEIEKMKSEIEKKENQIKAYLNKQKG